MKFSNLSNTRFISVSLDLKLKTKAFFSKFQIHIYRKELNLKFIGNKSTEDEVGGFLGKCPTQSYYSSLLAYEPQGQHLLFTKTFGVLLKALSEKFSQKFTFLTTCSSWTWFPQDCGCIYSSRCLNPVQKVWNKTIYQWICNALTKFSHLTTKHKDWNNTWVFRIKNCGHLINWHIDVYIYRFVCVCTHISIYFRYDIGLHFYYLIRIKHDDHNFTAYCDHCYELIYCYTTVSQPHPVIVPW